MTGQEARSHEEEYAWECAENMRGWAQRAEATIRELRAERAALVAERDDWKRKASGDYNRIVQQEYDQAVAERDRLWKAAAPLARLPLPMSSDERVDWLAYQYRLREVMFDWLADVPAGESDRDA